MSNQLTQQWEKELKQAGWRPLHATQFWIAPSGFKAASLQHAFESMKLGADLTTTCSNCGQEIQWGAK